MQKVCVVKRVCIGTKEVMPWKRSKGISGRSKEVYESVGNEEVIYLYWKRRSCVCLRK